MPTLTLICHGATGATRAAAFPRDEPIEPAAARRAAALAPTLRRVDRSLTSPALRARQTATALGLTAETTAALADCDFGRWAGRSLADIERDEPDGVAAWLTDADAAPHGGELLGAVMARVAAWLASGAQGEGRVVAVTHPAVIRAAILHVLAAPAASFWRIDVAPLARVRLDRRGRLWTVHFEGR